MDRKKTKKDTSNSSQTPMDVRKRLEKLEEEKEELEERMKQLKADRDEERAKANLYTEIQRVSSTVNAMQQLMLESREELRSLKAGSEKNAEQIATVKKATDDLQHNLGVSVEKAADISSKIDRTEERQTANHNEIIQRLTPVKEQERIISRQVDKKTILILGGGGDDMFILRKDRWIKLSLKLPRKNYEGGAVFLKGELYIFGGWGMRNETYKLDKQLEWKRLADMNGGRTIISNSCLEWKGQIWVFGGKENKSVERSQLKSVERYDPKEDKWMRMPDMKYSRISAAAAVWNDKFIVCGGRDRTNLESVECFDPESGIWSQLNDMPSPYAWHSLVPYGNELILTRDKSVLELSDTEGGGKWRKLPSMKYAHRTHATTILNNEIFVIGGNAGPEVEIFDGQKWRDGPPLPFKIDGMSAVVIPSHLLVEYESN